MALPNDSQARKETPIFSGLLMYFPDACAAVSRLSYLANEKHNPGEPMHWSKHKSADHADCIVRHLMDARGKDEFGLHHATAVAWRALALLQTILEEEAEAQAEPFIKVEPVACDACEDLCTDCILPPHDARCARIVIHNPLDMGLGGELAGVNFPAIYSPVYRAWIVKSGGYDFKVFDEDFQSGYAGFIE